MLNKYLIPVLLTALALSGAYAWYSTKEIKKQAAQLGTAKASIEYLNGQREAAISRNAEISDRLAKVNELNKERSNVQADVNSAIREALDSIQSDCVLSPELNGVFWQSYESVSGQRADRK